MPHAMRWRLEWQANCSTEVGSRNFAAENKAVFLKNIKNKSYFWIARGRFGGFRGCANELKL